MSETLTDRLTETEDGMRLFQQERTILEVTELICETMDKQGVCRSDLAKRIGKSKGYITQLLDGRTNMTLRTMSDVFVALGSSLHFSEGLLRATNDDDEPMRFLDFSANWEASSFRWPDIAGTEEAYTLEEKLAG